VLEHSRRSSLFYGMYEEIPDGIHLDQKTSKDRRCMKELGNAFMIAAVAPSLQSCRIIQHGPLPHQHPSHSSDPMQSLIPRPVFLYSTMSASTSPFASPLIPSSTFSFSTSKNHASSTANFLLKTLSHRSPHCLTIFSPSLSPSPLCTI